MPRYTVSYAYDVPFYFDFTVEAESEEEAEKKAQVALDTGVLSHYDDQAEPCYDNQDDARVFVDGETNDKEDSLPKLEELITKVGTVN